MKNEKMRSIAVCSPKGGTGKTTNTILIASWLHYALGQQVVVVDCDYPQWSVSEQREREFALLDKNDYYKLQMIRQYKRTGQKVWPVVKSSPEQAVSDLASFLARNGRTFDVALFDLPGTVNVDGVFSTLAALDYLFVPLKADKMVMEPTLSFCKVIHERFVLGNEYRLRGLYLFWVMVDGRERNPLYERFEEALGLSGLPCLKTRLPMRSRFSKEMLPGAPACFRSTIFAPDAASARDCQLDALVLEMCNLMEL